METLTDYSNAEIDNIRSGKGLVDEHEVMLRWKYDPDEESSVKSFKKLLWRFRTGRHPSGLRLNCLRLGNKRRLYRLSEVIKVEHGLMKWNGESA